MTDEKRINWRQIWPNTPDDGIGRDPNNSEYRLRVYKTLCPEGTVVWY
ncbi:hypothetical protein SAMN05444141_101537 [Pseudovibrio denitrificans]|uniref:Uncharacterized protein n=1 Tax=Pseudovibrio denitrificans TaxID=258256 RepID=A0A1I6XZG6_9HYPH|nr:hypothetical protein SAMN05444141_101537 [Pseudovibrio denitrificans]